MSASQVPAISGSGVRCQASGWEIKAGIPVSGSPGPALKEEQGSSSWAWWVTVTPGAKPPEQRARGRAVGAEFVSGDGRRRQWR